jgi:uncharacterized membrane protein YcaP (DUF421 family)
MDTDTVKMFGEFLILFKFFMFASFIMHIILSVMVAEAAQSKGFTHWKYLIASIIFSPLMMVLLVIARKEKVKNN